MSEKTTKLATELDELYKKAKSKEEYEEVIKIGRELKSEAMEEYFIELANCKNFYWIELANGKNFYWSRYYLLLKFSDPERDAATMSEADNLLINVLDLSSHVSSPETKIELLYLESVIYSQLLKDTEAAKKVNDFMRKIIRDNNLPISFLLQNINARGIKEMNDKNWEMAIDVFSEILPFSKEELNNLENPDSAANVFSNLGASLLRNDKKTIADIERAREYLAKAQEYCLEAKTPSEKHLQGVKNRLEEADREEAKLNKI